LGLEFNHSYKKDIKNYSQAFYGLGLTSFVYIPGSPTFMSQYIRISLFTTSPSSLNSSWPISLETSWITYAVFVGPELGIGISYDDINKMNLYLKFSITAWFDSMTIYMRHSFPNRSQYGISIDILKLAGYWPNKGWCIFGVCTGKQAEAEPEAVEIPYQE